MRLSTKGRVAVTALIDIALREDFGPVRLTDVARRQKISLSYLEQLFSKLRLEGLVTSTRGPHGGYMLGHRSDDITVTDIIVAVDSTLPKARLPDGAVEQDITTALWDAMSAKVFAYTKTVTLKSLIVGHQAIDATVKRKHAPSQVIFSTCVGQNRHSSLRSPTGSVSESFQAS